MDTQSITITLDADKNTVISIEGDITDIFAHLFADTIIQLRHDKMPSIPNLDTTFLELLRYSAAICHECPAVYALFKTYMS